MGKILEGISWTPTWTSLMGCYKGISDYHKLDNSLGWVFGATGNAFVINICHRGVCPSGPTAWKSHMLPKLASNIGLKFDGVFGFKPKTGDLTELQTKTWERTREYIDRGIPGYSWDLVVPEYYIVKGYDNSGYLFSGPAPDESHKNKSYPWDKLGEREILILEMHWVDKKDKADKRATIKEALEFAVEHATTRIYLFDDYESGLDAFDIWIDTLRKGEALYNGMSYNTAAWYECRHNAVIFLKEVEHILAGSCQHELSTAIDAYSEVESHLSTLHKEFPFSFSEEFIKDSEKIAKGCDILKGAKDAEASAIGSLKGLIKCL